MLSLLHHLNPCADLMRLGELLSPFTDEETDLRGQTMCLETQLVSMGQQGCSSMWLCVGFEPRESVKVEMSWNWERAVGIWDWLEHAVRRNAGYQPKASHRWHW